MKKKSLQLFFDRVEEWKQWNERHVGEARKMLRVASTRRGMRHDANLWRDSSGRIWQMVGGMYTPFGGSETLGKPPRGSVRSWDHIEEDWAWLPVEPEMDSYAYWRESLWRATVSVLFATPLLTSREAVARWIEGRAARTDRSADSREHVHDWDEFFREFGTLELGMDSTREISDWGSIAYALSFVLDELGGHPNVRRYLS